MASRAHTLPPAPIIFGDKEWTEEVERFDPKADARLKAQSARKEVEVANEKPAWTPCEAHSEHGTRLPGCRKLYIPLDQEGASAAPYGFVFQLVKTEEGLAWNFVAFGERHPSNAQTRSVYERAHKRLHGRYP